MKVEYRIGDCLEVLREFPNDHFDSCVTDPPYFLIDDSGKGFMGKEWESFSTAKAIQLLCKSNEYAQSAIGFLKSMQVEPDMVEGSIAQGNASTKPMDECSTNPLNSSVKSVEQPSGGHRLTSKESTKSVQGSVFTKDALQASLKELSLSPTTVIESLSDDALFAIPDSLLQRRLKGTVPADALRGPIKNGCEGPTILLTSTGDRRITDTIEAMIGRTFGSPFISETNSDAESVASTVAERRYRLITSVSIESQETIRWIIWLLFVLAVISRLRPSQRNMRLFLKLQMVYEFHRIWSQEVYRVLKPGAHILVFGGPRTYHRMTCALEDVGFEVRDSPVFLWVFGSGFPKSLDVSKAIDKHFKAERAIIGEIETPWKTDNIGKGVSLQSSVQEDFTDHNESGYRTTTITAPATPEAQQWQGWGTALKPSYEPIVLARKPLEGTVAKNVLKYGTGGINVDGCRIGLEGMEEHRTPAKSGLGKHGIYAESTIEEITGKDLVRYTSNGRWPSNVLLDEEAAKMLDEQSGERPTSFRAQGSIVEGETGSPFDNTSRGPIPYDDLGGASRFFYVAKADRFEREAGLVGNVECARCKALADAGEWPVHQGEHIYNDHPTVKPIELMRYLVRLVTPPQGRCLDPFAGSGTTLIASALEQRDCFGVEKDAEKEPIIAFRLEYWKPIADKRKTEEAQERKDHSHRIAETVKTLDLFDSDNQPEEDYNQGRQTQNETP